MAMIEVKCPICKQTDDEVYRQLRKLLRPFGIKRLYTDNWGAYTRHQLVIGKKNTQHIESKHLNFRTRLKRFVFPDLFLCIPSCLVCLSIVMNSVLFSLHPQSWNTSRV